MKKQNLNTTTSPTETTPTKSILDSLNYDNFTKLIIFKRSLSSYTAPFFILFYLRLKSEPLDDTLIAQLYILKSFLKSHPIKNLSITDSDKNNIIHHACIHNDIGLIKLLIQKHPTKFSKFFLKRNKNRNAPFELIKDLQTKNMIMIFLKGAIKSSQQPQKIMELTTGIDNKLQTSTNICRSRANNINKNMLCTSPQSRLINTFPGYLNINFTTFLGFIKNFSSLGMIKMELVSKTSAFTFYGESYFSKRNFMNGNNITSVKINQPKVSIKIIISFNKHKKQTFYPVAEFKIDIDSTTIINNLNKIGKPLMYTLQRKNLLSYEGRSRPYIVCGTVPLNLCYTPCDDMTMVEFSLFKEYTVLEEYVFRRRYVHFIFFRGYLNYRLTMNDGFYKPEKFANIWRKRYVVIEGVKMMMYDDNNKELLEIVDMCPGRLISGNQESRKIVLEVKNNKLEMEMDDDYCYEIMLKAMKFLMKRMEDKNFKGIKEVIKGRDNIYQ